MQIGDGLSVICGGRRGSAFIWGFMAHAGISVGRGARVGGVAAGSVVLSVIKLIRGW